MATFEFRLPDLGEGVTEAEIASWLVAVGQAVAEDDPLVEVETDKATVEVPSPVDGVVEAIHVAEGERVPVGTALISIATADDRGAPHRAADPADGAADPADGAAAPADATSADAASPAGRVRATPGARHAARELGVDLSTIAGSGPEGAISERDVRAAAAVGRDSTARIEIDDRASRRQPLRGVRRRIAERLSQSQREIPQVTVVEECDFTDLDAQRDGRSHAPFVIAATASGLTTHPELNATLDGDAIVLHERCDIGVAVEGPHGLIVPVVRDADRCSLDELDAEVARLVDAARRDVLAPAELRDSTFTVTLAGKLGGYFATPLVNPGEAAILGVHRIAERPVVRDGEIVVRSIGLVSCTFDHRLLDGACATRFLLHVIGELERATAAAK